MMTYLLLQHPGHNRVFFNASGTMALSELSLACSKMSAKTGPPAIKYISGIRYLSFDSNDPLSSKDLLILSRLSFAFALFIVEREKEKTGEKEKEKEKEALRHPPLLSPVEFIHCRGLDEKLGSILKYQGKTNELFTRMMINIALLSSQFGYSDPIRVLDPVAGKGTTLFEAAIYGFDATGVETDPRPVHESITFFRKFLQTERLRHNFEKRRIAGAKKADAIFMEEFTYFPVQKICPESTQRRLGMIAGDAAEVQRYFKKERFHLIVGDLPYGIQHGSKSGRGRKTRNPSELLQQCLPGWKKVLHPGGAIAIAWNTHLISKEKVSEIFSEHGLEVMEGIVYEGFKHRVDHSIRRDVVVGKKS